MKTAIKNGQVLYKGKVSKRDILIEDNLIVEIGKNLSKKADEVIDATGLFVAPGLVDVHVHYREPGQTDKETIKTGSKAAAHGGFTTVCAMPNVTPAPDTVAHFNDIQKINKKDGVVHIKQYATITSGRTDGKLVNFKALKKAGAFAFSNDGSGIQGSNTMYEAMQQAAELDMAIVEHVQDDALTYGGVLGEDAAKKLNIKAMPWVSETAQAARDIILAQATGVHYHICHVSSRHTLAIVKAAKKAGIHVTCEVSPHHLILSGDDINEDNSMLKMNPPLRSEKDRQALVKGLLNGTIDMIATDHAPHTDKEKDQSIKTAPFGITGSETAFSMLYTKFVKTGIFTLPQLIKWMSKNPAKKFDMKKVGKIKVGWPADLAIFDLKNQSTIEKKDFASKGNNSPFIGQKVYGKTMYTLVDGKVVYQAK